MPPFPAQVLMCAIAKLVTVMSEREPVLVPRRVVPMQSHESSITLRPYLSAMSQMASQSGALPTRFGIRMAPVLSVIISSILVTSTLWVSGSTSTKTGTQPPRTIGETSFERSFKPNIGFTNADFKHSIDRRQRKCWCRNLLIINELGDIGCAHYGIFDASTPSLHFLNERSNHRHRRDGHLTPTNRDPRCRRGRIRCPRYRRNIDA